MIFENYCGDSLNEVAQCLKADQTMMVKFYPEQALPVDVVTYPVFEKNMDLNDSTVVYVTCSKGYYRIQIMEG